MFPTFSTLLAKVRSKTMDHVATLTHTSRRDVVLHDAMGFGALILATAVLFSGTLYLFRSFEHYRSNLATEFAERGARALEDSKAHEAALALRTAISFESDSARLRDDQVQLAEALAQDGHYDEANNYFLALWEAKPADGPVNLQLARLAKLKDDPTRAADYYRAAIDGSWPGDSVAKRNEVRMELSQFLVQNGHKNEARNLLFVVAGNSPDDARVNLTVADRLSDAGFLQYALNFYRKAAEAAPTAQLPLGLAGRAAFELGQFSEAEQLLNLALEKEPDPKADSEYPDLDIPLLSARARRIQELNLSSNQPGVDRAAHILLALPIAQGRLKNCLAQASTPALLELAEEWKAATPAKPLKLSGISENAVIQDFLAQLIYTTEQKTVADCGEPAGDDALLLILARKEQSALHTQPEQVSSLDSTQGVQVRHGN